MILIVNKIDITIFKTCVSAYRSQFEKFLKIYGMFVNIKKQQ